MPLNTLDDTRKALRQRLLAERRAWASSTAGEMAQQALHTRLTTVLSQLEPECLGLYWPMQGEFNPRGVAQWAVAQWPCTLALPFARKNPVEMHFRTWNGSEPATRDECGIPSPEGKPVVPDVVLVPCLGFTPEGWRLGYGGGYFDRFMAAHPHVTAIGLAWEAACLDVSTLMPQPHDQTLMAVLTESSTWSV